tara:strand:- start:56 stop:403 length:348 start_codon:yes stop_codon:yes gene_type:complete
MTKPNDQATATERSSHGYASFDDWYQEVEGFALRAERLASPVNELRAAFDAGRTGADYLRDLLRRLVSEIVVKSQAIASGKCNSNCLREASWHEGRKDAAAEFMEIVKRRMEDTR